MSTKNYSNKIVFLDAGTLNHNVSLKPLYEFGTVKIFKKTSHDELLSRIESATIIITNKVVLSKEVLSKAPQLKLICIAATGMNNVDLDAAAQLGISVKNVVGYSTNSVVQHTFAFATNLLGSLSDYAKYSQEGSWCDSESFTCQNWSINEIANKTWGIIGLGNIGKKVAEVAKCFGANIQYHSTSGKNNNQPYSQVDLNKLMSTSDIISIHAPLNEQTSNLINSKNLKLLKENATLINVGRGGIVNEDDLLDYLKKNKLLVGLDVLKIEPMDKNSSAYELSKLPSVIMTPHTAWSSLEAQKSLMNGISKNISEFIDKS